MSTTALKYSKKAHQKPQAGPPTCPVGGHEAQLTLNERFVAELVCHECGDRSFIDKIRQDDAGNRFATFPAHHISPQLHELRKRLEREARG